MASKRTKQLASRSKAIKRRKKRKAVLKRYDPRRELGLNRMRDGYSLSEAARMVGVTPSQLRGYVAATGIVTRKDGKWHFKRDRRFRHMPLYSDGRRVVITVRNGKTASLIGAYMSIVRYVLETEDIGLLDAFRGQSVPDIKGKRYVFETRPNVLFRLDASGVEPFELAYEIVKTE